MLYIRFLGGAGGVLLALMLLANAFLPKPEATASGGSAEHPTIRITATTKGPERVVIDTSLPTTTAPQPAATNAASPSAARLREAFAAAPAEPPARAETAAATPAAKDINKDAGKDPKAQAHKSTHKRIAAPRSPYYYERQPQQPFRRQPQFAGNFFGFWLR